MKVTIHATIHHDQIYNVDSYFQNIHKIPVKLLLTFFPLCIFDPICHDRSIFTNVILKCLMVMRGEKNTVEYG